VLSITQASQQYLYNAHENKFVFASLRHTVFRANKVKTIKLFGWKKVEIVAQDQDNVVILSLKSKTVPF